VALNTKPNQTNNQKTGGYPCSYSHDKVLSSLIRKIRDYQ